MVMEFDNESNSAVSNPLWHTSTALTTLEKVDTGLQEIINLASKDYSGAPPDYKEQDAIYKAHSPVRSQSTICTVHLHRR
jgi:hypothetical protein